MRERGFAIKWAVLLLMAGMASFQLCGSDDMEIIRHRLCDTLLNTLSPSPEAIAEIKESAREDGSFKGVNYEDQNRSIWRTSHHMTNLRSLAWAWAKPKSTYFQSPELGEIIRRGIIFWSTRKIKCPNWWYNEIGVPSTATEVLLLSDKLFSAPNDRRTALDTIAHVKIGMTGQNRVWLSQIVFRRALLSGNHAEMRKALVAINDEIRIAPPEAEGINVDGCFHQHGPQIQFGNYGTAYLHALTGFGEIVAGTSFALARERVNILRFLITEGFDWIMWKGRMDLQAQGRQFFPNSQISKCNTILRAIQRMRKIDSENQPVYDAILARNQLNAENDKIGTKFFWNSDLLVVREPEYYASLRMVSTRTAPIEDYVNSDNMLGRYFSDGALMLMRSGNEYRELLPCWDWTRIPGTTLPATPRYSREELAKENIKVASPFTHSKKRRNRGEGDFTGAVTAGRNAAAVYEMKLDGVTARKAWFFAPGVIAALGSGIRSESPFPVATTVNQCRLNGPIKSGPDYVWHDGTAYFGCGFKYSTKMVRGDWQNVVGAKLTNPAPEAEIFTLTIDHGTRCRDASYEYVIMPGVPESRCQPPPPVKFLSNTPELQAVELPDGKIGAVFYVPGSIAGFSTDSPGVFLLDPSERKVFAADPTHKLKQMTLAWLGKSRQIHLPENMEAGQAAVATF